MRNVSFCVILMDAGLMWFKHSFKQSHFPKVKKTQTIRASVNEAAQSDSNSGDGRHQTNLNDANLQHIVRGFFTVEFNSDVVLFNISHFSHLKSGQNQLSEDKK